MADQTKPASGLGPFTIAKLALQTAVSQLGQRETAGKNNTGPMVDKYLAAVGLKPGYAWCQAFVYWCYLTTTRQHQVGCPVPKTPGVLACWQQAPEYRRTTAQDARLKPLLIQPGAQFFLDYGRGLGHTGIVEYVNAKERMIHTIEGNSNDEGDREGYEVCRRVRSLDDKLLKGFVNYL